MSASFEGVLTVAVLWHVVARQVDRGTPHHLELRIPACQRHVCSTCIYGTTAPTDLLALAPERKLCALSLMTTCVLLTCSDGVQVIPDQAYWCSTRRAVSDCPISRFHGRRLWRDEGAYESKMRSRLWDSDAPSLREQIRTSGPSSSTLAVTPTRSPLFASRDRVAYKHKADT